jgi:5-methylcytosine-specific restriction endonuclease McrA
MVVRRCRLTHLHRCIVASRQAWRCQACAALFGAIWHVDHITPLCEDGSNAPANLQALCETCHAVKTSAEAMRRAGTYSPDRTAVVTERPAKRRRIQAVHPVDRE